MINRALEELGVSEFILRGEPTTQAEFEQSFKKITGSTEDNEAIVSNDPEDFGVTWAQVSAKITELEAAEPLRLLRAERDKRLAETDWWVMPDRTATDAQRTYRQALRDITDTYTSLDDVVWPEKP